MWALLVGALTCFAANAPQVRHIGFSYPLTGVGTNLVFGFETNNAVANLAGWNTHLIIPSMVMVTTNGTTNLVLNGVTNGVNADFLFPFVMVPQQLYFRGYASNTFWGLSSPFTEVVSTDPLPQSFTLRIE